jgi:prepilin peptidase CpaA
MRPEVMAVVVALFACVFDLRSRRIPNALTLGSAAAALAVRFLVGGIPAFQAGGAGWLLGIALFLPFFVLGGLGAGDVKLLGALGAWLGAAMVWHVAMYTAMAGGVLGLAVALRTGYLKTALANLKYLLTFWSTVGLKPVDGLTVDDPRRPKLAYAVPILAGLMVTLWMH